MANKMNVERVIVGSSKVTSRGQVTIPLEVREKHNIKPGDTIYFIEENGKLILKKGPLKL